MYILKLACILSLAGSFSLLATADPLNSGYLIGFGRGFDPTQNKILSGTAQFKIVRNQPYCASGTWCKQIVFGNSGGSVEVAVRGIRIRGPPRGVKAVGQDSVIRTQASARRLYQSNSCTIDHAVYFDLGNGNIQGYLQAEDPYTIPWGVQGLTDFATEAPTKATTTFDGIVNIVCAATTDTTKPPTVFLDALSGSFI